MCSGTSSVYCSLSHSWCVAEAQSTGRNNSYESVKDVFMFADFFLLAMFISNSQILYLKLEASEARVNVLFVRLLRFPVKIVNELQVFFSQCEKKIHLNP